MPQIIYHFSCDCDVTADKVVTYHYDPKTRQRSNRAHCPKHLDAHLVEKTIYCQCGCNKPFKVGPKNNNAKYHPDCRARVKAGRIAAWHKRNPINAHHQTEYIAPPQISPIQKHEPFEPGDIGIEFPTGFSSRDIDDLRMWKP